MADKYPSNSKTDQGKTTMSVVKKKARKYFFITLAFIILIIGGYIYWSFFFTFSDGYRAGLLQKFSRKGNIFKTYEGEMILSSVQSNKNVALASEKFVFSVADHDVALQLEKLQGKNVVVHYTEKNQTLPWRGETVFIVSSVKLSD
ncbi:MAG: hypothetical protein Q7U54_20215 [Bacteroidales bacterium]|nr:hypothetical protein [Bacteroidales bacterium]